jgi:hypothetical protein
MIQFTQQICPLRASKNLKLLPTHVHRACVSRQTQTSAVLRDIVVSNHVMELT